MFVKSAHKTEKRSKSQISKLIRWLDYLNKKIIGGRAVQTFISTICHVWIYIGLGLLLISIISLLLKN
jgi:hypothetical protein